MEYQNINIEIISMSENISKTFTSALEIPSDTYNSKNENVINLSKSSKDQIRADGILRYHRNPSQSEDTNNNLKKL